MLNREELILSGIISGVRYKSLLSVINKAESQGEISIDEIYRALIIDGIIAINERDVGSNHYKSDIFEKGYIVGKEGVALMSFDDIYFFMKDYKVVKANNEGLTLRFINNIDVYVSNDSYCEMVKKTDFFSVSDFVNYQLTLV